MTKRDIRQLVVASYTRNRLDEKKVEKIANLLSKNDLKAYIRGLKLEEQKHKIYLALPTKTVYNKAKKEFEKVFEGKEIVFTEDPSLLWGLRVLDNDMLYEVSLAEKINQVAQSVEENY